MQRGEREVSPGAYQAPAPSGGETVARSRGQAEWERIQSSISV